jgi:hypothetical protein
LLDKIERKDFQCPPAVISAGLKDVLDEYRGFRHVVRNVYTHHLSAEKIKALIEKLRRTFIDVEKELSIFAAFLEEAK